MNNVMRGMGMTSQRTRDRMITRLQDKGIKDQRVLAAMRELPRHCFVDEALATRAYEDTALPIGHSQTISHPYTVARMTELLINGDLPERVLEIGTGSGYQAALLSKIVPMLYTVERISVLQQQARRRFRELNLPNIRCKHSDGSWGWVEQGPFDAILVTAAPQEVPNALLEQLAIGARLILPLGDQVQRLAIVTRKSADAYEREDFEDVKFVPLLTGAS
ncbi:MAG: protein-L-isoaspartate(D-aspartate) O-methyltransferase [Gammaproteobacteria bacterium]|nr:protein-L-isoaspartate(D-aspartate) O-methyltransferase [Gammaproteobacteria bacterium]